MTTTKACTKCGEVKPLAAFFKRSSAPDGLTWFCKTCSSRQARAYEKANAGRVAERVAGWRSRNSEAARGVSRTQFSRWQAVTTQHARNHRKEWTGPELELAADHTRSSAEVARALGRTYAAVVGIRRAIRYDPRKTRLAGIPDRGEQP